MDRLSLVTLPALGDAATRPAFDPRALGIGIVHLGIGAFHRAHQAIYTDEALTACGGSWGICGVSLRSPDMRERMRVQDGLYTAVEKSSSAVHRRIVGSVREVLYLAEDRTAVAARLAAGATRIVSLTVTEKGYCHDPATGRLNFAHADIAADLGDREQARSVVGLLTAAFSARRAQCAGPLSVVCCDNLPHNGAVLRGLVAEFAHACDPALARWIEANAAFPSTMVDRIVPAPTAADIADNDAALGLHDAAAVVFEPFRQWVIEERFVTERPQWEAGGAQFVADVAPFELMKLRMLNGSHSALAYLGYLAGYDYIYQVSADPRCERLLNGLWDEAGATLPLLPGIDLACYRRDLLARYRNAALPHRTWQIAMDGSQKLPQRLLHPARERLLTGAPIAHLALAVAGWMRYVDGIDERGQPIDIRDPLAAEFKRIVDGTSRTDPDARVRGLLSLRAIFGDDLPADRRFVDAVSGWYRELARDGVRHVLDAHFC